MPSSASTGKPSASISAAAASHHSSSTGRVTSTWNCRPHVVAPTRKAWTQAGLRASTAAPAGGRQAKLCHSFTWRRCGAPASRASLRAASANSIGTQPTSPAGIRSALPSRACAINWAPRQMPSTGRPRACASAMTSRSRSSGASPSVPSGLTMPPSTIRPSNDPAGGSGREGACQVTVRTPSAAIGGASAASGESRSCWTTSTVGFAVTLSSSPIGALTAPSRDGTEMRAQVLLAMGLLYFVWGSTYLAIRVTVETLHAAGRRRGALHPRGLLTLGGTGSARPPRPAAEQGRVARLGPRRGLAAVRRRRSRHDHGDPRALQPDRRARVHDIALGRRLPGALGRAHRARVDRGRRIGRGRRDRAALARRLRSRQPVADRGGRRLAVLEHGLVLRPPADAARRSVPRRRRPDAQRGRRDDRRRCRPRRRRRARSDRRRRGARCSRCSTSSWRAASHSPPMSGR